MRRALLTHAAVAVATITFTLPASASFMTTYEVSIDPLLCPDNQICDNPDNPPITHLVLLEDYAGVGQSLTWDGSTLPADDTTTVYSYSNPYQVAPTSSLLMGIVTGLPTDLTDTQEHLVLFMDSTAATNVVDIPWDSVFSPTVEDSLIAAVRDGDGNPPSEADPLFDFFNGDAQNGNLGPNGTPGGTAVFTPGGSFTAMVWSNGAIIGSGTSTVTDLDPVPIPAAVWLCGSGLLGMIGVARKKLFKLSNH